jgi:serine/threonine protein kinase
LELEIMIHCPQCAIELDPRSPLGLCPACSLRGLDLIGNQGEEAGQISGIKLGRLLGQGAFGKVFEGRETSAAHRRVAVKILSSDQPGFHRARFLEEMSILAKLNHAHLATLYHSGKTTDGSPYYVMELVDGAPMGQWARGKSRDESLGVFFADR